MNEPGVGRRLLHAYLVTPADGAGLEYAQELARAAVCTAEDEPKPCGQCAGCRKALKGIHPDILLVDRPLDDKGKAKKELVVSQSREIIRDAYTLPNEAPGKAYIIQNADAMNTSAQNALLKILEEPPSYAHFILLASNPLALLPTVRSRLATITLQPGLEPDKASDAAVSDFMAALDEGSPALVTFCVSIEKLDRAAMEAFLHGAVRAVTARMRTPDAERTDLLAVTDLLRRMETMQQANVSSGHLAGLLLASLIGG